jgi:hypothetical protein
MKLIRKGSIGFIGGGLFAVVASLYSAETQIPAQIKLFVGVALILFGLGGLLFVHNYTVSKHRKYGAILFTIFLLTGFVGYFYVQDGEGNKEYVKSYGTFQIRTKHYTYPGNAILDGNKLTFQIKGITPTTRIDGFKLYIKSVEIETRSIEWVCALMEDFSVIRCSTDLNLPKDNSQLFFNGGTYTISYWLMHALEDAKISDISFKILTNGHHGVIRISERNVGDGQTIIP